MKNRTIKIIETSLINSLDDFKKDRDIKTLKNELKELLKYLENKEN